MSPVEIPKGRHTRSRPSDRQVLDSTFSIDTRALSVVRVLLAGLILFQSLVLELSRARDAAGPLDLLIQYADVLVVPFAIAMAIGFKTRFSVVACWILYSMGQRADFIDGVAVDMGDYILNIALFWCMFLPLGRHLAIDFKGTTMAPRRYLSVASGALLFQVFIIYFSAGLYKDLGEWVFQANAMETLLAKPTYSTSLGMGLLDYPAILAVMSIATVLVEVIGAVLILIPGRTLAMRRMVMVPVFIAFHLGIVIFMGLGLFPFVMMAIWLIFLPTRSWNRIWSWFGGDETPELEVDPSVWRNGLAGIAVLIAAVTNVLTWMYFPDYVGWADQIKTIATYLMIDQQWVMFSVPSLII